MQKSSFEEKVLSIYRKFETLIAVTVSIFIALIILVALISVGIELVNYLGKTLGSPAKFSLQIFKVYLVRL